VNVTDRTKMVIQLKAYTANNVTGYTAFLTGTEFEHAHAIVRELTKLIRERLSPPMRFVKLEGDAVFCYAEAAAFAYGERFVELIEVCYFDFSNRLLDMTRGRRAAATPARRSLRSASSSSRISGPS